MSEGEREMWRRVVSRREAGEKKLTVMLSMKTEMYEPQPEEPPRRHLLPLPPTANVVLMSLLTAVNSCRLFSLVVCT